MPDVAHAQNVAHISTMGILFLMVFGPKKLHKTTVTRTFKPMYIFPETLPKVVGENPKNVRN